MSVPPKEQVSASQRFNPTNPQANEGFLFQNWSEGINWGELAVAETQSTYKVHGSVRVNGVKEPVPWTGEFPTEVLTYDGMTELIPGWGGIKRSSRDERHANAVLGRPTVSFDPARVTGSIIDNLTDSQAKHAETAERVLLGFRDRIRTDRGIPLRSQIDSDKAVLSVHSMGGHAGTDVGLLYPGFIESVIYKGSVGFGKLAVNEVNVLEFFQEVAKYASSGRIEPSLHHLYRIARYYCRKPSRTAGEALTCLTTDRTEDVLRLGQMGVSTAYLAFEKDPLVSAKRAEVRTKGIVNLFAIMGGVGHLAPQMYAKDTSIATFELQRRVQSASVPYRLEHAC